MAYNPKGRVKSLLKRAKKALKIPKTITQKNEFIEKQAKKMGKKMTKPERTFVKICKELKIEAKPQKIVGGKIFDFYVESHNTLVEIDGTYWHGFEKDMKEVNGTQRKAQKNDQQKNVIAVGYGYKILRIWEHELEKEYEKTKKIVKDFFEVK